MVQNINIINIIIPIIILILLELSSFINLINDIKYIIVNIVNNKITNYKCKGSGTSIVQSLDENGYLKIDGLQTNIKVKYSKVVGGQVKSLPISSILLLICLCLSSHPLIWLIKSVVPFTKKQCKKLTDVLNKI